jgi:hypothetical protein
MTMDSNEFIAKWIADNAKSYDIRSELMDALRNVHRKEFGEAMFMEHRLSWLGIKV